jgi:hypothetical protein
LHAASSLWGRYFYLFMHTHIFAFVKCLVIIFSCFSLGFICYIVFDVPTAEELIY